MAVSCAAAGKNVQNSIIPIKDRISWMGSEFKVENSKKTVGNVVQVIQKNLEVFVVIYAGMYYNG